MAESLVVGFDLDMTLLDTRPGIMRVWDALSAATGVHVDSELAASRLGPPLSVEVAEWVPADQVDAFVEHYRALYPDHAIADSLPLPGVVDALAAVRRWGGRSVVVTAKHEGHAQRHMDHLGLDVDEVVGGLWGASKGEGLRLHGATIYVGDHVLDIAGARAAGAVSVGVATGPCGADELSGSRRRRGPRPTCASSPTGWTSMSWPFASQRSRAELRELGSLMVAFSGGADSAFLLAAAVRTSGRQRRGRSDRALGLVAGLRARVRRRVRGLLGVRHVTPETHEMDREGYRANAGDRCYFCKAELVEVLAPLAGELGIAAVATGTNADDARAGFRPGHPGGRRARRGDPAARRRADQGADPRAVSPMGAPDLGQAGRGLPVVADRLRASR